MFKYHYLNYHSNKKVPAEKNPVPFPYHGYNGIMGLGFGVVQIVNLRYVIR